MSQSSAPSPSRSDPTFALALAFGLAVCGLVVWFGGLAGIAYAALYALALAPGLPIGWRLLGRGHAAGWVAGAFVGYGLTCLAFWLPIRLGIPHAAAFAAVWLALGAASWWFLRSPAGPLVDLPPFGRRDAAALLIVLLLVVAFLALPFGRLGEEDAAGRRSYRAYFTADFVWHAALTQEVARLEYPPRNPYFARDPVHYYWTYYLAPAVLSGPAGHPLVTVEAALKLNATGQALLMFSLVFLAAWSACGARSGPAALASVLALMAPSYEGLYKVVQFAWRGTPMDALRDLNIDAISAWDFRGLRIDGLVRSMWYTPQHTTSFALGLVAVIVASRLSAATRWPAFLLTGVALGLSVAMNPLLGAAFCAIYGATVLIDVLARRLPLEGVLPHAWSVVPVGLALVWCLANQMGASAGGHLFFGWLHDTRAPLFTLFLSLGGLLLPAMIGLVPARRLPFRAALPAVPALIVGLGLLYFVSLTDRSWVGFRAGNILQVALPMLIARGFALLFDAGGRALAAPVFAVLLATGAPTTLIDTFNAQDIENLRPGPGFKWTLVLSPAQLAAFDWIRGSTSPDAVIQADPIPRDRRNWSVMPTFAGRRMAAGLAIPLLPEPAHEGMPERVHALVTRLPPDAAHAEARALGIDYLYLDGDDPGGAAVRDRFAARPDLFTPMFRQGDVVVYRLRAD